MDKELLALIQRIQAAERAARAAGEPPLDDAEIDDFLRTESGGKVSLTPELAERIRSRSWVNEPAAAAKGLAAGLLQGATFNFADEALDAVGARGAAAGLRRMEADAPPGAFGVGNVAGAVAPALLAPAAAVNALVPRSAGLLRTAAAGGAVGATEGALAGAGAAESGERLGGAGMGAAGGAIGGAALPLMFGAARRSLPQVRAEQRMVDAIERSGGPVTVRARADEARSAGYGGIVRAADLGPGMRTAADFAATNDPATRESLEGILERRQAGMTSRLLDTARRALGDPDAPARQDFLTELRQRWADGPDGFAGLREQNPVLALPPNVRQRLRHPNVRAAFNLARQSGDMTPETGVFNVIDGVLSGNRSISFEDLHGAKQILDDRATAAFERGNGNLGKAYATIRDEFDEALATVVPDYARRRDTYRYFMDQERALAAGQRAWDIEDTRQLGTQVQELLDADPSEGLVREFRRGMASELVSQMRATGRNRNLAAQLTSRGNEALDNKLATVFGDAPTLRYFLRRAEIEAEMAKLSSAVGNSKTAARLADAADVDPAGVAGAVIAGNPVVAAGRQAAGGVTPRFISRATAQRMRPMLMATGKDLDALLERLSAPNLLLRRAPLAAGAAAGAGMGLLQEP